MNERETGEYLVRGVLALERIATALEGISNFAGFVTCEPHGEKPGYVRTSDIDRGKVYGEHLGRKLSDR